MEVTGVTGIAAGIIQNNMPVLIKSYGYKNKTLDQRGTIVTSLYAAYLQIRHLHIWSCNLQIRNISTSTNLYTGIYQSHRLSIQAIKACKVMIVYDFVNTIVSGGGSKYPTNL